MAVKMAAKMAIFCKRLAILLGKVNVQGRNYLDCLMIFIFCILYTFPS